MSLSGRSGTAYIQRSLKKFESYINTHLDSITWDDTKLLIYNIMDTIKKMYSSSHYCDMLINRFFLLIKDNAFKNISSFKNKQEIQSQFAMLCVSLNKIHIAMYHLDHVLTVDNPQREYNYLTHLIQNAKVSAMMGYYEKSKQFYERAIRLSKNQNTEYMYEFAKYWLDYRNDKSKFKYHMDKILKIDPTNVRFAYMRSLHCAPDLYPNIRRYAYKHYTGIHKDGIHKDQYSSTGISLSHMKDIIENNIHFLIAGYSNQFNTLFIHSDVQNVCYKFLIGNSLSNVDTSQHYCYIKWSTFAQKQISKAFWNILIPGHNSALCIRSLTKIIDMASHKYRLDTNKSYEPRALSDTYLSILLTVMDFTNMYRTLSMIQNTTHYINILFTVGTTKSILILDKLLKNNNTFSRMYMDKQFMMDPYILFDQLICNTTNISLKCLQTVLHRKIKADDALSIINQLKDEMNSMLVINEIEDQERSSYYYINTSLKQYCIYILFQITMENYKY